MIRCPWCGAKNYAIDMWCARCKRHLDWAPPRRRNRLVSILAPTAAAIGVAIAVAIPVAGWLGGTQSVDLTLLPASRVASQTTAEANTTAAATPATVAPSASPASTPAPDSAPLAEATPAAQQAALPALPVPPVVAPSDGGGEPAGAVRRFYEAVSAHQFDVAASLWSPAMTSLFPPTVFIDQRFSATEQITVRADRVVATGGGSAVVYVDVIEVIAGAQRYWIGTWQLVDTSTGWLLNRPNLRTED